MSLRRTLRRQRIAKKQLSGRRVLTHFGDLLVSNGGSLRELYIAQRAALLALPSYQEFQRLLHLAMNGDAEAIAKIPAARDQYLRETFGELVAAKLEAAFATAIR